MDLKERNVEVTFENGVARYFKSCGKITYTDELVEFESCMRVFPQFAKRECEHRVSKVSIPLNRVLCVIEQPNE